MNRTTGLILLTGAAIGAGAANLAQAATPAPTGVNTDEIRALVADMLSDAETRSSLLQSGSSAGHDGHFFLASPDGAFRLNIKGQMQFRYTANFREDGNRTRDDFNSGFTNQRMRLVFDGHVYNDFFFKFQSQFAGNGGADILLDSFFGYEFDNGMKIQAGQFKLPFSREELTSSTKLLAADRSFTDGLFGGGRSQGVMLSYSQDQWRASVAFSDGFGALNTGFTNDRPANPTGESDFAFTGRFEYLGAGAWDQFKDFTSPRGSEGVAWMIGAAGHFQSGADSLVPTVADGGTNFSWTVDASVEGDGWAGFAAFYGRHSDQKFTGPGTGSSDQYAFVAQGSYYLTDNVEPFVRWDEIIPDSGTSFNTLTAGANYYIHGHAAKFTLDFQWFMDAPSATTFDQGVLGGNPGIGLIGSGIDKNEFVVRAQFQLLF